jgi:formamidopyrimidine-DNA glycosylase
MPELPEVQTVCDGIKNYINGAKILNIKIINKKLRIEIPKYIEKLSGTQIQQVRRKAKYILIELNNNKIIVVHLGMSGKLTIDKISHSNYYHNQKTFKKHDHLKITLDNGYKLTYNDTRKFGLVDLINKDNEINYRFFKKLGYEPLDSSFTKQSLEEVCSPRKKNIKSVIMDANLIVGIGNIYACESLFKAKIAPSRPAESLNKKELGKLFEAIVTTLQEAITAGGSTIQDYANPNGEAGYFQHSFFVYDRENLACKICKAKIRRTKDSGRSTYYCPKCQK